MILACSFAWHRRIRQASEYCILHDNELSWLAGLARDTKRPRPSPKYVWAEAFTLRLEQN